jgi:hypothetical protein
MRSTAIINKSTNISKDTAMEYRTAYRESAVVKNALQQRQHQKGMSACVFANISDASPRSSSGKLHTFPGNCCAL